MFLLGSKFIKNDLCKDTHKKTKNAYLSFGRIWEDRGCGRQEKFTSYFLYTLRFFEPCECITNSPNNLHNSNRFTKNDTVFFVV